MYYVVVNRHKLQGNKKHGTTDPIFRVSRGRYGSPSYFANVEFVGATRLCNIPDKPLPCGATVWIEAEGVVAA